MTTHRVLLIIGLAAFLAGAPLREAHGAPGDPCADAAECEGKERCEGGSCVDESGEDTGLCSTTGTLCVDDKECPEGDVCELDAVNEEEGHEEGEGEEGEGCSMTGSPAGRPTGLTLLTLGGLLAFAIRRRK